MQTESCNQECGVRRRVSSFFALRASVPLRSVTLPHDAQIRADRAPKTPTARTTDPFP